MGGASGGLNGSDARCSDTVAREKAWLAKSYLPDGTNGGALGLNVEDTAGTSCVALIGLRVDCADDWWASGCSAMLTDACCCALLAPSAPATSFDLSSRDNIVALDAN